MALGPAVLSLAVSHRIWAANKGGEGPALNLRGLAVGNGLTDPSIQFGERAGAGRFANSCCAQLNLKCN